MPNAVEINIVYDDKTLIRLEGMDAVNLGKRIESILLSPDFTFVGRTAGISTVTRPLRKVTEVEGRCDLLAEGIGHRVPSQGLIDTLPFVCPDEVRGHLPRADNDPDDYQGPLCKFRITVEATPLEEHHD